MAKRNPMDESRRHEMKRGDMKQDRKERSKTKPMMKPSYAKQMKQMMKGGGC